MTGAEGGGEDLEEGEEEEEEDEVEEEDRPGAGRAEGGLEGGGSLPALFDEGKEEGSGEEHGRRKGLRGEEELMRLGKSSRGRMRKRRNKLMTTRDIKTNKAL